MSASLMVICILTGCSKDYSTTTADFDIANLFVFSEISYKPDTSQGFFGAEILSSENLEFSSIFGTGGEAPLLSLGPGDEISINTSESASILESSLLSGDTTPSYASIFNINETNKFELVFSRNGKSQSIVSTMIDGQIHLAASTETNILNAGTFEQVSFDLTIINPTNEQLMLNNINAGITVQKIACLRNEDSIYVTLFNIDNSYSYLFGSRFLEPINFSNGTGNFQTFPSTLLQGANQLLSGDEDTYDHCDVDVAGTIENESGQSGLTVSTSSDSSSNVWLLSYYLLSPTITLRLNL